MSVHQSSGEQAASLTEQGSYEDEIERLSGKLLKTYPQCELRHLRMMLIRDLRKLIPITLEDTVTAVDRFYEKRGIRFTPISSTAYHLTALVVLGQLAFAMLVLYLLVFTRGWTQLLSGAALVLFLFRVRRFVGE